MSAGGVVDSTRRAARADAEDAVLEFDDARAWFAEHGPTIATPLAVEVWLFDPDLRQVVLVDHRWRRWVPPGGKVEPGEPPRGAAEREVFEETGLRVEVHARPAAVAVRSYAREWDATLGLSYVAIGDPAVPLRAEVGQDVAWWSLADCWESAFPDDVDRMRTFVAWLRNKG